MHETTNLSQSQKAAAILVALGREQGAKLLGRFAQEEVRHLMLASRELSGIPQETLEGLVAEFEQEFETGAGLLDSSRTIEAIIEDAFTPEQIEALARGPDAVDISVNVKSAWEILAEVEIEDLCHFLTAENPQISAYIMLQTQPARTAEIISKLDSGARRRIVACMITSRPALADAVKMIENLLIKQFGRATGNTDQGVGRRIVAGMFNEMDHTTSEDLFKELLEEVEEEELQTVRSLMFKFVDIANLDNSARAKVFDRLEADQITLALRDATPVVKEAVLSALGQRTRRMLESELETESSASPEDIVKAQKAIASLVLQMAEKSELKIPQPDLAA